MAKEASARLQHYVPQYYLRGFLGKNDKLYVVDRPEAKFFRVPTKKVGGEKYFNLVNVDGISPFAVEEALNELETKVAPILEKVKAAPSLADQADRSAVLNLMAAVTLRNPKQRAVISELYGNAAQQAAGAGLASKEKYAEFEAAMKAQGKAAPPYEEMKEWFKADPKAFKSSPARNFHILTEFQTHDLLVKLFEDRQWQIIIASDDSGGFVTSDYPVCLRWIDDKDQGGASPGFGMPGTEVIFPISPKTALRGRFDDEENVVDADAKTVAEINSLLISNAYNQVYARDALFNYTRGSQGEIGSGSTLDQDKVFLAGGTADTDVKVVPLRVE